LQALAETYEQMKEFGLAAEALKKALALSPPNAAELRQAMAQDLVYAQKYADALQIYEALVADDPPTRNPICAFRKSTSRQRKFNDAAHRLR